MFYVKTLAEKRKDVKKAATNFVFLLWKVQFSYIWCHYSLNFCIKTQLKFLQNQISSEDISLFYAKSLIIFMELVVEKFDFFDFYKFLSIYEVLIRANYALRKIAFTKCTIEFLQRIYFVSKKILKLMFTISLICALLCEKCENSQTKRKALK